MDTNRHTADRVRPILQAMERSIDAARQQRLRANGAPAVPVEPVNGNAIVPVVGDPAAPPRLKARPKRSPTLPGYTAAPALRFRAS